MAEKYHSTTAVEMVKGFFTQLVVNSLIIWMANRLFPAQVVLGNANSNLWWSIFHSMTLLSLIGTLCIPLFEWKQKMIDRELTTKDWMLGYLAINFAGLWVISRFSEQFGLGISAWWVVLMLSGILDMAQGMGMMVVYNDKKK